MPGYFRDAPREIQRLPLDLLRSGKYPRDPRVTARGIEQFRRGEHMSALFSTRAAQRKWHSAPYQLGFGENIRSMYLAMTAEDARIARMQADVRRVPVQTQREAVLRRGLDRLPNAMDRLEDTMYRGYRPISPNVMPLRAMAEFQAVEQRLERMQAPSPGNAHREALVSASAAQNMYGRMFSPAPLAGCVVFRR